MSTKAALGLIAGLCVAGIIGVIVTAPRPDPAQRRVSTRLAYDIGGTSRILEITNRNEIGWRQASLVVNDRWTCRLGDVEAGATLKIPMRECATEEGVRFSEALKVLKVQVRATVGSSYDVRTMRLQ